MNKYKIMFFPLLFFVLYFSSCYIDNNENSTESSKVNMTITIPVTEDLLKAPPGSSYFNITLYHDVEGAINREFVTGITNVMDNSSGTAIFPVILNDIPTGLYNSLDIEFYHLGEPYYNTVYELPFTIIQDQNTTINVTF